MYFTSKKHSTNFLTVFKRIEKVVKSIITPYMVGLKLIFKEVVK